MLSYEGTSLQALRKQAVYLGLFVQVARDSLGTNSALFGVVYFFHTSAPPGDLR